jgi:hypothetical protein
MKNNIESYIFNSVSIETESKTEKDINLNNYFNEFFGLSETGTQTDLTGRDIEHLLINHKILSQNNNDHKFLQKKRKNEKVHVQVKNIVDYIISSSVIKSEKNSKIKNKKIDAYMLFKKEFKQLHKDLKENELEKQCKNEWKELPKDVKKFYNMNAENENKQLKRENKLKKLNEINKI